MPDNDEITESDKWMFILLSTHNLEIRVIVCEQDNFLSFHVRHEESQSVVANQVSEKCMIDQYYNDLDCKLMDCKLEELRWTSLKEKSREGLSH